jgi:DtxR family Mn-dependent transcriptional regulator
MNAVSSQGCATTHQAFLQYLEKQQLTIGKKIMVTDIIEYDNSMILQVEDKHYTHKPRRG